MLEVRGLSKEIDKKTILNDIDITVEKGSIYGLVGPNGSGKTTLIKHLVGVYKQDAGTVELSGEVVYENPEVKQKIAYISDELYFYPRSTIEEVAKMYKEIYDAFDWNRYEKIRESLGLEGKDKINKLSKGMKRQVAFLLALSCMPEIMILDEPLDGLDPLVRKKILNMVIQDVESRDMSVLISSHNIRELEEVCDTVGIMSKGKVVAENDVDELKEGMVKVQVSFENGMPNQIEKELNILNKEQLGKVSSLIIKGNRDEIISKLEEYNPTLINSIGVTLEEVFIYELGDRGYSVDEIII